MALCLALPGCGGFADRICQRRDQLEEQLGRLTGGMGPAGEIATTLVGSGLDLLCGTAAAGAGAVDAGLEAAGLLEADPGQ